MIRTYRAIDTGAWVTKQTFDLPMDDLTIDQILNHALEARAQLERAGHLDAKFDSDEYGFVVFRPATDDEIREAERERARSRQARIEQLRAQLAHEEAKLDADA